MRHNMSNKCDCPEGSSIVGCPVCGIGKLLQRESPKQAKILPGFLKLNALHVIEGEFIAETNCADYSAYRSLPVAIEVQGKVLGKTGWNSDTGIACYKEKVLLGRLVDIKA